jgi:hypothetical protein
MVGGAAPAAAEPAPADEPEMPDTPAEGSEQPDLAQ